MYQFLIVMKNENIAFPTHTQKKNTSTEEEKTNFGHPQ